MAMLLITFLIIICFDGKVVIAYSSVVHMSLGCVLFVMVSFVGVYCGLVHVIVSPLMFFICYMSYSLFGSRSVKRLLGGYVVLLLLLINMSFPPFGAFLSEVWMVSLVGGLLLFVFLLCYYFFVMLIFLTLFGTSSMRYSSYLVMLILVSF